MSQQYDHESYLSPLSWRYGSDRMRKIWSEANKRRLWREIWVALAEAQQGAGLVSQQQVDDLRQHKDLVDLDRAWEIEQDIHHDLMSEVQTYAEQCQVGGGIIHLGATSMDIEDNADVLRMRQGLDAILEQLRTLLDGFVAQVEKWARTPTMAFTHLQPAEPTTIGYRLAQYTQDLWVDWRQLKRVRADLRGKGFKGATGTSASYTQLLCDSNVTCFSFEQQLMEKLGVKAMQVATQTYARKQDYLVLSALAGLGQTLYRFAFDLRLLQSPPLGELAEPFAKNQVGSSAMPFKRNPINAEKIDSLARYLAVLPRVAWDNAAHNLLERTLDDSANRRLALPQAFLITDELLRTSDKIIGGLRVDEKAAERLLHVYGPFAATERLMMEAVKQGGDRQQLHAVIREHCLQAWEQIKEGKANPLVDGLCQDARITDLLPESRARSLLDAKDYTGDASSRALALGRAVQRDLKSNRGE